MLRRDVRLRLGRELRKKDEGGRKNGANGMSDIEGKARRVGVSERGKRTSFN
jgi:hypothetical protein